jgi:hypothetical protein
MAVNTIPRPQQHALEVYVDNFMAIVIPTKKEQMLHVANVTMQGIHDCFLTDDNNDNDPILLSKMKKGESNLLTRKTLLGFDFDSTDKTLWLEENKQQKLLTILQKLIRSSKQSNMGILFDEFQSVIAKIHYAFTAILAGNGLMSPCNAILKLQPQHVFLHKNEDLRSAIEGMRTMLHKSTVEPMQCCQLVSGWPNFIGIKDALSHGVGGVILGKLSTCPHTVFCFAWPDDIQESLVSPSNRNGTISNSDLEMAGLLLLFVIMEQVCGRLVKKRTTLFSDNSSPVSWVERLASKHSRIAAHLI